MQEVRAFLSSNSDSRRTRIVAVMWNTSKSLSIRVCTGVNGRTEPSRLWLRQVEFRDNCDKTRSGHPYTVTATVDGKSRFERVH
jgi:hypothetical protein